MLQSAVAGRARSHLSNHMRKASEDKDNDICPWPSMCDDAADDYEYFDGYRDSTPNERFSLQHQQISCSAYLAWQALCQTDETSADKTLAKLAHTKCNELRRVAAHLDTMDDLHEKYRASFAASRRGWT